jgi:hypothetical protein
LANLGVFAALREMPFLYCNPNSLSSAACAFAASSGETTTPIRVSLVLTS